MNIANLGLEHIKRHGEYVTAHFEGRDITNVEVHRRASRLGNALLGLGIKENQTVAVIMSNCPEVFESFSGIFAIGAVVLPILFVLTAEEVRFMLEDSEAVAVPRQDRRPGRIRRRSGSHGAPDRARGRARVPPSSGSSARRGGSPGHLPLHL